MARKGLIKLVIARERPTRKISFLLACCFMTLSGGGGEAYKKRSLKMSWKHFKEGDINEELINKMVQQFWLGV